MSASTPATQKVSATSSRRRNVTVNLSGGRVASSYDILIGEGILEEAGALIFPRLGKRRCLIITDSEVGPRYKAACEASLKAAGHDVLPTLTIPAGEASKSYRTLETTLNAMLDVGVDRKSLIIALGGGVVGDLAGLAASLVMRGLDYVQIPTTLLAQVDSSVGGKTAIDTARGKNLIGAFYHPRLVIIDVNLLATLPLRELRAGYAEIIKYGLIRDAAFFQWCVKNGTDLLSGNRVALAHAIETSCHHKAKIVAGDEREDGERALLNFGHTFGHALETMVGYGDKLRHGEAVAIGMVLAFRLSAQLKLCPPTDALLVETHLQKIGMPLAPPATPFDLEQLMTLMAQDKKAEAGTYTLVLARAIGQAFVRRDVEKDALEKIWKDYYATSQKIS